MRARQFKPRTFLAATLVAAIVLVTMVAVPQWMSKQARLEVLRTNVGNIARLAAAAVNGDLHRQLLEQKNYTPELYARALAPLVRFHSAMPDIFYVYTMVAIGEDTRFILDTANSPDLHAKHSLQPSGYFTHFQLRKEYDGDWLQRIGRGETWVTPTFQRDDYGNFLTGHAPIYDSRGLYSGFVGVDFDLQYYLAQERDFRLIGTGFLLAALIAALLIGYLIARYHFELEDRIEQHYHTSIRDDLTMLLNRRGALQAIQKALSPRIRNYAALLVDIDNLKAINDTHGHAAGDRAIHELANVLRDCIRHGDICARLGGDEFMIFAPDCDAEGAADLAHRILANAGVNHDALTPVRVSVSIGISLAAENPEFDRMYRNADAALYRAKSAGKRGFHIFEPPAAELSPS